MLAIYNRIAFHRPAKVYGAQNLFEGFDVIQLDHAAGPSYALFSEFWYFADLQEKKEFIPQEPRLFREGIHFKRLLNGYFPVQASIYLDEEGSVRPLSAHLKEDFLAEYGTKTRCDHRNESRTNLTRFPIHLSADLSMKLEGQTECPGVLSIPWAAISGWRATVNGEHRPIVRVGDTTLGILIPKGKWKIEVYYDPKFLGLTLFISIMTFMIVLVLMVMDVGRVLKKQWVQS